MSEDETFRDIPVVRCQTDADWEAWLAAHYEQTEGVWLKFAKKASGLPTVSYNEAVDTALCYGWIDGLVHGYDAQYYLQKFTPRRPGSVWSKINVEKVHRLTEAGRMQPSGLAAAQAAQHNGRWGQAYDSPSTSRIPDDFQALLDAHPAAKAFFATLSKSNIYAILWRIQTARTAATRQTRMEKLIAMLEAKTTIH